MADLPSNPTTNGTVTVDGSKRGEIEIITDPGDWFAVDLEEGRTYQIDVKGSPTDGTLDDPLLTRDLRLAWRLHQRYEERRRRRGLKQPDHVHGAG